MMTTDSGRPLQRGGPGVYSPAESERAMALAESGLIKTRMVMLTTQILRECCSASSRIRNYEIVMIGRIFR